MRAPADCERDRVRARGKDRHPLNLSQLSTTLPQTADASEDEKGLSESFRAPESTSPGRPGDLAAPLITEEQVYLGQEREFYARLVKAGAQPWYPIHLIEDVFENPERYSELLRYWKLEQSAEPHEWGVFRGQFQRWENFCKWRAARRERFSRGSISEYTEWAKESLAEDSFTPSFQLNEDPERQDKRTTWIEYLTYEHIMGRKWKAYRYRPSKGGGLYRKWWGKLRASGLLKPHETEEVVLALHLDQAYYREVADAEDAEDAASSALSSAERAIHGSAPPPSPHAQVSLETLRANLEAAEQGVELVRRRHVLIRQFYGATSIHRDQGRSAERHAVLLQWIRDQFPIIEHEMEQ